MATCRNNTEENINRLKGMRNKVKKAVSKTMTEKVVEALSEFNIVLVECLD